MLYLLIATGVWSFNYTLKWIMVTWTIEVQRQQLFVKTKNQ